MYPQNVTIGVQPKFFSVRFARSFVLYPHIHSSGAVSLQSVIAMVS